MAAEVTDPSLLAQLNSAEPNDAPAADNPGTAVTDPNLLAQLNADNPEPGAPALQHPNSQPADELPFFDRVHLAQADNWNEKKLYLENRYGKGSVEEEWGDDGKPAAVVHMPDGKVYRVGDSGFVAKLVGDSPVLAGMVGGALIGSAVPGPGTLIGGVLGAGLGAVGGKAGIEADKYARGNYDKSGLELGTSLAQANEEGEVGEMTGGIIGKGVSKLLTTSLPKFITGATDDSIKMTKDAWAGGGRPSYASMAPALKKLQRTEILDEKLNGEAVAQTERNTGYIVEHTKNQLTSSGVPKPYVDQIADEMRKPSGALSHEAVGEDIKAAVEAHVDTIQSAIDQMGKVADSQIDAQLKAVDEMIDSTKHLGLAETIGGAIKTAKKSFSDASEQMYSRIDSMIGDAKVVPTDEISSFARQLIRNMPKSEVARITKEAATKYGQPEMSAEDALLLDEFGVQVDKSSGKISLGEAQRLRTTLRNKGDAGELTRSVIKGDHLRLADVVDDAIHAAEKDPLAAPAIKALDAADGFYKAGIAKFKDTAVKQLAKDLNNGMPRDPEAIVKVVTAPGRSSRTSTIRRIVGEDTWRRVQSVHMQRFMDGVTSVAPDGKRVVDGLAILKKLRGDAEESFAAVHGPDGVKQIKEIATMVAARKGALNPDVLANGNLRSALESMKSHEARLDEFMKRNALAILADGSKTGEQAYQWVARPGAEGEPRLMAAVKLFGINSPQIKGLQQAALEDVMREASIKAIGENGGNGLEKALDAYTANQSKILFPDGMARDLKSISDVIKFMFPKQSGIAKDQGAAGFTAGAILNMPLVARVPVQVVVGLMRTLIQTPTLARWIAIGREENEFAWMTRTAELLDKMAQPVAAEADSPAQARPPAPPLPRPGQQ